MIDKCVRKVANGSYWDKIENITALYEDGINLDGQKDEKTYFDFVKDIYRKMGGNNFFEKFVDENYRREIILWRHRMERQKILTSSKDIQEILKKVKFEEFDFNQDQTIEFDEFQRGFRLQGFHADPEKLRAIFDNIDAENDMDGRITVKEFKQWKKKYLRATKNLRQINKVLKTDVEIQNVVKTVKFEDFDYNKDETIVLKEFKKCFKDKGYRVNPDKLEMIFGVIEAENDADDKITRLELKQWKQNYIKELSSNRIFNDDDDEEKEQLFYVYYDEDERHYEFVEGEHGKKWIERFRREEDKYIEWAVYSDKLKTKQANRFRQIDDISNVPIGFWHILSDNHENNKKEVHKSIKRLIAPREHLYLIYKLLHYYYILNIDKSVPRKKVKDKTPLARLFWDDEDDEDQLVRFLIDGVVYQLIWWNQQGKNEPNAISLMNVNESSHNNQIEVCYMRFKFNIAAQEEHKCDWQWYDNNNSDYKPFASDQDLLKQLEVSFLGNVKQNYDPTAYNRKFNNCLLTKLRYFREHKAEKRKDKRDYTFRVTFSEEADEWNNVILNMEQITINHEEHSSFPRNIRRFIDGRNSLDFLYRDSTRFVVVCFRFFMDFSKRK